MILIHFNKYCCLKIFLQHYSKDKKNQLRWNFITFQIICKKISQYDICNKKRAFSNENHWKNSDNVYIKFLEAILFINTNILLYCIQTNNINTVGDNNITIHNLRFQTSEIQFLFSRTKSKIRYKLIFFSYGKLRFFLKLLIVIIHYWKIPF